MADNQLHADVEDRPVARAAAGRNDARPAWLGFLGGALVLVLAILIAVGIWHFVGGRGSELSSADLLEIETLLDQLGFSPGAIDGQIDEASRNAIRDFQLTAGLEVNGLPNLALLDELRAAQAELGTN